MQYYAIFRLKPIHPSICLSVFIPENSASIFHYFLLDLYEWIARTIYILYSIIWEPVLGEFKDAKCGSDFSSSKVMIKQRHDR